MRIIRILSVISLLLLSIISGSALAEDKIGASSYLLQGEVISEGINVRTDSTSSAEVICKLDKGKYVYIVAERWGWYKIRLPDNAPLFVKKSFVSIAQDKTARVIKDKVNVRIRPDISSAILGKLHKDQTVKVLDESGEWIKIEPAENSFGWIHKSFVNKLEKKMPVERALQSREITVEGIIKPKVFTRAATHKLITEPSKVYLLRGNKEELNSFNGLKVRVSGRIVDPSQIKTPIVEVEKIEALP